MDNARVSRPSEDTWGQVIFEQEAGSILRRYDEVGGILLHSGS